jgi:hypothetical protein
MAIFPDNEKTPPDRSPRWDISQERAFIENLLVQRVNFLLVFFSIFIAGAVNARKDLILQTGVLTLGAIIAFLLAWAILRTQKKLDFILENLPPSHPHRIIDNELPTGSYRHFVGYFIPCICFAAIALWALCGWTILIVGCHHFGRFISVHCALTPVSLMMAPHLTSSLAISAA